jgi:hypothetical protein
MKNIEERAEQIIEYVLDNTLYDYEASDKIIKLADEFAIGFAEWVECSKTYYTPMNELLEIYKREKGL